MSFIYTSIAGEIQEKLHNEKEKRLDISGLKIIIN